MHYEINFKSYINLNKCSFVKIYHNNVIVADNHPVIWMPLFPLWEFVPIEKSIWAYLWQARALFSLAKTTAFSWVLLNLFNNCHEVINIEKFPLHGLRVTFLFIKGLYKGSTNSLRQPKSLVGMKVLPDWSRLVWSPFTFITTYPIGSNSIYEKC